MKKGVRGERAPLTLAAVIAGIGLCLMMIPFFLTPPATLILSVEDHLLESDLEGEVIYLSELDTGDKVAGELDAGNRSRSIRILSGHRRFKVELPGFKNQIVEIDAPPMGTVERTLAIEPIFGQLEVQVLDASSPDRAVSGEVVVELGDQKTVGVGKVVLTRLEPGRHEVTVTVPGFCAGIKAAIVEAGRRALLILPLAATLAAEERARLILDWGENPRDLDAHLLVTDHSILLRSGHVFFNNKEGRTSDGLLYAELDVDWRASEAFETVTIYQGGPKFFSYYVHHYSGIGSIGESGAVAEIFTKNCARIRLEPPPSCRDKWWYVADLELTSTAESKSVPRKQCTSKQPFSLDLSRLPHPSGSLQDGLQVRPDNYGG